MRKYLIVVLCVFSLISAKGQEALERNIEPSKNNIFKGFVIPLITFNHLILGYERVITKHSSLELVVQGTALLSSEFSIYSFAVMPGYKYYIKNEKSKFVNNLYFSLFAKYMYFENYKDLADSYAADIYGGGIVIGKLLGSLSKRLILDVNLGVSYNYRDYRYYDDFFGETFTKLNKKSDFLLLPKLGIYLGYRF